jgi:hypothetical protein
LGAVAPPGLQATKAHDRRARRDYQSKITEGMKKNIHIKKNEAQPESAELLASSIVQVADGFKKVLSSPLSQRALIVLIQDAVGGSNISKSQIKLVLEALPRLKGWYIK